MKPLFFLAGPTAAGKTDLAIDLVERYPFEIISVDSALVYRGMDIGTAKPDAETLRCAPHALIDVIDPAESYSAARFRKEALREIGRIEAAEKIPLLVGGTMLYYRALQFGLSVLPESDPTVRQQLQQQLEAEGLAALRAKLEQIDPKAAERINQNDPQRILRALEVFEMTGTPLSELQKQQAAQEIQRPIHFIAVSPEDRTALHQRIAQRFDWMLQNGFIEEVESLRNCGDLFADLPSMRSVGYRQVWSYLEDELNLDEMRDKAIVATRQLAKRQLTWLRNWPSEIQWIDPLNSAAKKLLRNQIGQRLEAG